MRCISTNYATNRNYSIDFAVFYNLIGAESQLETAGYGFYHDIFVFRSVFFYRP